MYSIDSFMQRVYKDVNMKIFKGDVLYLGMGPLWLPILQGNKVVTTTIIEIDQEMIQKYEHYADEDWKIICADAWEYVPNKKFDVIYADIWHQMYEYSELEKMFEKYKDFLKPGGKIYCLEHLVRKNTIPKNKKLSYG